MSKRYLLQKKITQQLPDINKLGRVAKINLPTTDLKLTLADVPNMDPPSKYVEVLPNQMDNNDNKRVTRSATKVIKQEQVSTLEPAPINEQITCLEIDDYLIIDLVHKDD